MEQQAYLPILKRVGRVLVIVGVIDIGAMVYCIVNGIGYSSSFNIFAVIAGVMLMRGSLKAASLVRWFSAFFLSAFVAVIFAFPFFQPISLTLAQLRMNPGTATASLLFAGVLLVLLYWTINELGHPSIKDAIVASNIKRRNLKLAVGAGVAIVAIVGVASQSIMGGETASQAKSIAEQQLGAGYRFHVTSLNVSTNNLGKHVSGIVTAWNDHEVKAVPVQWDTPP